MTAAARRPRQPLTWWVVLLFVLLLPLLPVYLWAKGRMGPKPAAVFAAVALVLYGAAALADPPVEESVAGRSTPSASPTPEPSVSPASEGTSSPQATVAPTQASTGDTLVVVEGEAEALVDGDSDRTSTLPSAPANAGLAPAQQGAAAFAAVQAEAEREKAARAAERKAARVAERRAARAAKRKAARTAAREAAKKAAAAQRKAAAKAAAERAAREKAQRAASTDPRFGTCGEANDRGYGDYRAGSDPECAWYQDRDGDGIVCER